MLIAVKEGDQVQAGQVLAQVDLEALQQADKKATMIVVFTNMDKIQAFELTQKGNQQAGNTIGTLSI